MTIINNYINDQLIKPRSVQYIEVFNPTEGKVYAKLPDSDVSDVQLAVDGARTACL